MTWIDVALARASITLVRVSLEIGLALHRCHDIGYQVGAPLVLVQHLAPYVALDCSSRRWKSLTLATGQKQCGGNDGKESLHDFNGVLVMGWAQWRRRGAGIVHVLAQPVTRGALVPTID